MDKSNTEQNIALHNRGYYWDHLGIRVLWLVTWKHVHVQSDLLQ